MLDSLPVATNWRYQSKMNIKPSAEVKKCLFGKASSAQQNLQTDLKQLLGEIQKGDRLRWNYDFKYDVPLSGGRYKWESVTISPATSEINANSSTKGINTPSTPVKSPKRPHSSDSPSTQGQRSIAEFFPLKKRSTPSTTSDPTKAKRMRSVSIHQTKPSVSQVLCHKFSPIDKPAASD